ncbi:class I SAM-dependent methyltransferase [Saccharopolyspora cebuensis]|uniref:Trans-aconitate 2-methyltransferase n=1 Tax=Saccharopolyspora cebuensis TaxID=418759 RepID=A0ABV4CJ35_9PSEU
MAQHSDHHGDGGHDHGALADLLERDAEVFAAYLDDLVAWVARHAPDDPRAIVDLGAGPGAGGFALAGRFPAAELVAVDRSEPMLERLRAAASGADLADRVRAVRADLDAGLPEVGAPDVVWAASLLHEVADPDRLLREVRAALRPGGLLAVVELDDLPFFLPADVGRGRPGLEERCHEVVAQARWNAHPDWRSHLERAGFDVVGQRSFAAEADPAPPSAGRYAHGYLSRIRAAFADRLDPDDVEVLDHLLSADGPESVLHRRDLVVRGTRTAWAARPSGAEEGTG